MKNSVKDRSNAQCSCAGHFIENHIDPKYKGGWLHVDMAGPGTKAERGTGYGVGLVLSLVGAPGFDTRSQLPWTFCVQRILLLGSGLTGYGYS